MQFLGLTRCHRKMAPLSLKTTLTLGLLFCGLASSQDGEDDYVYDENTDPGDYDVLDVNLSKDPCAELYPTCQGCLVDPESQGEEDAAVPKQCVFQVRDSEIRCVQRESATVGLNTTQAVLISVLDGDMCRYVKLHRQS